MTENARNLFVFLPVLFSDSVYYYTWRVSEWVIVATGKLYHLRLWVEFTLFCNLESRARTHAVLVIGLYELLGNPTTYLIEPPEPS
jgi:hypothetical protein